MTEGTHRPAWLRRTPGEHRWPATLAVVATVALQLLLPDRFAPQLGLLLPALQVVLLIGLVIANPLRIDRESAVIRWLSLGLLALVVLSTGWSAVLLVRELVSGRDVAATTLLVAGAGIWLTTVLTFALVFWELDRGGPAERAAGTHEHADFVFAQMQTPDLAPADWEPRFGDYLYLAAHLRHRVQPDRRPAADPAGQGRHGGRVRGHPGRRPAGPGPRGQRPRVRVRC